MKLDNDVDLVDIRSITIDTAESREEQMKEYLRQVKNPYCFCYDKLKIECCFSDDGPTLDDCIKSLVELSEL